MPVILDAIDAEVAAGGAVYLHCWGGCGRSGSVAGAWLVRHGVEPEVALARFAALARPVSLRECPETEAQRSMVRGWGARM
jgi:protein-tyrosine phosphatase